MRYRVRYYESDLGWVYNYPSLSLESFDNPPSISDLVPTVLYSLMEDVTLGTCSLPLTPRHVLINLFDGRTIKLEYPFRPFTLEWQQFWDGLSSNTLINTAIGVGEFVPHKVLKIHLDRL